MARATKQDPDGEGVAAILDAQAQHHQQVGRLREAVRGYRQALAILSRSPVGDGRMLVSTAVGLSSAYLEIGQSYQAEDVLQPLIESARPLDPDDRNMLRVELASIRAQRGDSARAEDGFLKALSEVQDSPSDVRRQRAVVILTNLTRLYVDNNRLADANRTTEAAVRMLDRIASPDQVLLIKTLGTAAALAAGRQNWADAQRLYDRAIPLCEGQFGKNSPLLWPLLRSYSQFLRLTDRGKQAKVVGRRADLIREEHERANALGLTVDARAMSIRATKY